MKKKYISVCYFSHKLSGDTTEVKAVIKEEGAVNLISFSEFMGDSKQAQIKLIELVTSAILRGEESFSVNQNFKL